MQKTIAFRAQEGSGEQIFLRDRFTWFAYILMGYGAYLQSTPGPLASIFQQNFHLSYSSMGLPTGALALGMIIAGLFGEALMRPWLDRPLQFIWYSGTGTVLGLVLLMTSQNIWMVSASTLIMGIANTLLQCMMQAMLANRHRNNRAMVLTEVSVVSSGGAMLAPLLIGLLQIAGFDWRIALCGAIALLAGTTLILSMHQHTYRSCISNADGYANYRTTGSKSAEAGGFSANLLALLAFPRLLCGVRVVGHCLGRDAPTRCWSGWKYGDNVDQSVLCCRGGRPLCR